MIMWRGMLIAIALTLPVVAVRAQDELTPEELLAKYPPAEDQLDPGMHWAPQFVRPVERPERGRFAVNVDWADNELDSAPVTFGVPFGDGALPSIDNARLITADGTEVPAQFDGMATWWRRDGPVRWALVNATLRRGEKYFVEYGTAVHRAEPDGMTVTEIADAIVINTGPTRVTISKTRPTLLDECALDRNGDGRFGAGETLITPELAAANLPTVVDGQGRECPASADGFEVSFIRRGPMQTVIRRAGWYVRDDGTRYCQFITYTWFNAGRSGVRIDHTLVAAFDSTQNQIRDIRLTVPVELTDSALAVFARDESSSPEFVSAPLNTGSRRLVQDAYDHWTLSDANGQVAEGEQAGGWCGLVEEAGVGVFAGVRDFREQYPMELEVSADGRLIAHLWPAHDVAPLDFTPSKVMGDEYPGDHIFWRKFYEGGLDKWTQAYGVGKTHNICMNFALDKPDTSRMARATRAFCVAPVIASPDPQYACATEAFGRVQPVDRERFPHLEKVIDALVYRKYWLRDALGNYGWINFGDVNYNLVNSTDPEAITYGHWRHWAQMFYGGPNVMPLLYLRSGRRDAWDFHRVNAKHIMDFDICHLDNEQFGKRKGGRYGGNGGICHYAANIYNIGCDCHLRFMLWDWYINGNPRAWEVAHEFADQYVARRGLHHNLIYRHRMTGGSVRFFSEMYEATWNPVYLSCARQFADILYQARAELGYTRYDDVYMNEGKVKFYQLTGDERMRDLFLNDMRILIKRRDADVFSDSRHTTLWGLAHAFWFTGDRDFLPYAAWQLEIARTRIPVEGKPWEIGSASWTFEHAYNSTLGNQLPVFMAMMRDAGKLPLAAGPTGKGQWAIYLLEEKDQPIDLWVEVRVCNAAIGLGAARFTNWDEWVTRLEGADRPVLSLLAPDGAEVARVDMVDDVREKLTVAGDTGRKIGMVHITAPADGQTGTYTLLPSTTAVPMYLQIQNSNLRRRVQQCGDAWVYGSAYYFLVPAGTGAFTVDIKALALRTPVEFAVHNAAGEEQARVAWTVGSECRHDWQRIELNAGEPARDEVWSLTGLKPMAVFLRFAGVPGYVGGAPDEVFLPDRRVELPAIEQPEGEALYYVDGPPGMGRAAALPAGVGVKISSPDGAPLMNAREGTVEMWVKDCRRHTDLHNRNLIRCGALSIYRRINLGTYIYMGGGHQTGFVLPHGRWTHLAATWRPDENAPDKLTVALYADGVLIGSSYTRSVKPAADWPGAELLLPADPTGMFVDELRVSDVARYDASFERPTAPFEPDEHTGVLCHFDGDGAAVVFGKSVELAAQ
ncbi:MAG: hypothetical protein J7M38_07250 [Armatimonadetes bacterium]|nr:hypothetical protein [Armatimonadota bacterium]